MAWIKAPNSDAKIYDGVVGGVKAKIGEWKGTLDMAMAPMDDHNFILRMDFYSQVQAFPIQYLDSLCILDRGQACLVNMEFDTRHQGKTVSPM